MLQRGFVTNLSSGLVKFSIHGRHMAGHLSGADILHHSFGDPWDIQARFRG